MSSFHIRSEAPPGFPEFRPASPLRLSGLAWAGAPRRPTAAAALSDPMHLGAA